MGFIPRYWGPGKVTELVSNEVEQVVPRSEDKGESQFEDKVATDGKDDSYGSISEFERNLR